MREQSGGDAEYPAADLKATARENRTPRKLIPKYKLGEEIANGVRYFGQEGFDSSKTQTSMCVCPNCGELWRVRLGNVITGNTKSCGCKGLDAVATVEEKIDALCDDNVFNTGFIHRLGYDPSLAMNQCLFHIESRVGEMGVDGKWDKSASDLCYVPRYAEAKR